MLAIADVGKIIRQINNKAPVIKIELPKFHDETRKNPVGFLNDFDRFCLIKSINDDNKMLIIQQCFESKARV